jgi:ABC-type transport system involved in multi-copper enzyme maturation permease subunit
VIGPLIRKEIHETVLDLRFAVATLLFVALIPLGVYLNCKEYQRRLAGYESEHQAYRDRYSQKVDYSVEAEGFRPPSVLSILATGLDPSMPDKVITSRWRRFTTLGSSISGGAPALLLGRPDFLFNVTYVVSLAALIFSFGSVSGERQMGTLRLMISHPVPRGLILAAKVAGRTIALVIPLLLAVLISVAILAASRVVPLGSLQVWPALLVIMAVTLLFLLAVVCLGIWVSTVTRYAAVSMVLVFFAWMLFVVAVPQVSPLVAGILYPVESRAVVDQAQRIAEEDIDEEFKQEMDKLRSRCVAAFEVDGYYSAMRAWENEQKADALYAREYLPLEQRYRLRTEETLHRIEQDYRNRARAQSLIAVTLSRCSPVSCYTCVVSAIAGTGLAEPDNFIRNAQRYEDEVKETIYSRAIFIRRSGGWSCGPVAGFDWDKAVLPDMVYHYPTLAEALQEGWVDVFLLGLFSVLFFVLAFLGFNRYDVR